MSTKTKPARFRPLLLTETQANTLWWMLEGFIARDEGNPKHQRHARQVRRKLEQVLRTFT